MDLLGGLIKLLILLAILSLPFPSLAEEMTDSQAKQIISSLKDKSNKTSQEIEKLKEAIHHIANSWAKIQ